MGERVIVNNWSGDGGGDMRNVINCIGRHIFS